MTAIVLPPPLRDPSEPWRLSVGCGPVVREPWHHADARHWPGMATDSDPTLTTWDYVGPVQNGLPWADLTFGGVVAWHMLSMLEWPDLLPALVEMRRVLAHGGVLRVGVPDIRRGLAALTAGDAEFFQVADYHESSIDGKFCMWLTQAGASRSVFTGLWLTDLLHRAGFSEVDTAEVGVTKLGPTWLTELDDRPDETLVVEARK